MDKKFTYSKDLDALNELLPPKSGEFLRQYILRAACLGLVNKTEAFQIKHENPNAWDEVYFTNYG